MAIGQGSKKSRTCDMDDALAVEEGTPGSGAKVVSSKNARPCKCLLALLLLVATVIIVGGAALLWYFLEYRVWKLESRVQQQYVVRLTILNRNCSGGLSSHTTSSFRAQAADVQDMVKTTVKASDLSRYFNSSTVFAFGEGSLVAHLWLLLSVPVSHVEKVNLEKVNSSLLGRLEQTASYWGYKLHLPSFSIIETEPKVVELLKASFDCYRYRLLIPGAPVPLRGPDTQLSSCLWHLQAGPGPGPGPGPGSGLDTILSSGFGSGNDTGTSNGTSTGTDPGPGPRLELRMEWLLPECRDRLVVYNTLTPSNANLITSVYGCSSHDRVIQVVSSGSWMTVIWKQGLYNYKDTFSLTAEARSSPVCSSAVRLQPVMGVQGSLRTPFYPSYYPPDTSCSWTLTVPSTEYGVSLQFEGYELSRANYNQVCTQGQWLIQNRRLCGTRGLQPYTERLYLLSTTTTVVMTSEVSLTGPGIQVHYSLFNQSDPCPGQFLCSLNGLCVPACDGIKDCASGLDERNCVCVAKYQCPEDRQCVDYFKVCDQHPDCPEAMDEENCTGGVPCNDMTYVCVDGTCLKKPNPECDSVADCPDQSDEMHCDCGLKQFSSRIVGGVNASEGEWPWQVSLQVKGQHICGGALVSSQWVISAAHCFYDDRLFSPSVWTVYLGKLQLNRGSSLEEAFRVVYIQLHQYYDPESHDYDLALLRLERGPSPGTLARPVCLPSPTHQHEPGLLCWVTGWGALREGGTPSNILQKVDVRLVSEEACIRSYGYLVTPRMLCAGYRNGEKDSCQGDSGGPLVCEEPSGRWFLAGVVSWGRGCGRADYYGVYTRVTKLIGWIKQTIAPSPRAPSFSTPLTSSSSPSSSSSSSPSSSSSSPGSTSLSASSSGRPLG